MSQDNERRARELLDRLNITFPDALPHITAALDEAEARERQRCVELLRALLATGTEAIDRDARLFRMGRNETLKTAIDVLTNAEPPTPTTEEG